MVPPARGITRRAFLARSAALAVSGATLGAILTACERTASPVPSPSRSPAITPMSTSGAGLPVIEPPPASATYGALVEASAFAPVAIPSAALRSLLDEVAAEIEVPVAGALIEGRGQARLSVSADDPSIAPQAYRLDIARADDGPLVTLRAGDEAGAYYGLLSLARLVVTDGASHWLRTATIDDAPGFPRRGAILDPYVLPDVGVTPASKALLLRRVRFGARHKLNFIDLLDRTPWPEIVEYCQEHHIELMNGIGYRDRLSVTPRDEVKRLLGEMFDAGTRSFAFAWDDIPTTDPEALAGLHAGIFRELYAYVRGRDPGVRVSAVLPPYGGVPGRHLVGSVDGQGERYLGVMRDALPDDVRVFWTGDGGVFSASVTTAGARAYGDAIGREIGLWDNDAIRFSRTRQPCSGRAPDLPTVVRTYMANLAGEASWEGANGEFALLTTLMYTWNPGAYDPESAGAAAEQILATEPAA